MAIGITGGESTLTSGYAQFINPNRTWYNNRRLIILHAWIVLVLLTNSTSGFDGTLLNSFQSLSQWESYFHTPSGSSLGVLSAAQNIGSLAGYPFAPYASDYLGRRPTIWIASVITIIGVAIQSASYNLGMFIGARLLIGFGLTFAFSSSPMLIAEISYPPYRAPLTSVYNSLWYSGNVIASWTTFGTASIASNWSWRIPSIMQGVPSLLQCALILFMPESPRWLISKGREEEALRILAYYHADGDDQDPLVQYEFQEIKTVLELERQVQTKVGWRTLVSTKGNRRRMLVIVAIAFFSQWSGGGLASYYLNKVLDTVGITSSFDQLLITAVLALWNLLLAVFVSFFVDRLGRRPLFLASCGGVLVFFVMQTVCTAQYEMRGTPAFGHAYIAFLFLYSIAFDIGFQPLMVTYSIEILPFSLRAKGFNVFNVVVSAALVFNQYVNPIALEKLAWKYYVIYCCWITFELVFLYFFIIETKNRTLEETAALFDGQEVVEEVAHVAHQAIRDEATSVQEDKGDITEVEKV